MEDKGIDMIGKSGKESSSIVGDSAADGNDMDDCDDDEGSTYPCKTLVLNR